MPSDVVNRQVIREALAALIDAALDSTWDVFNYGTSDFNGKARNIFVASGPTDYLEEGAEASETTASDAEMDFGIGIFILYADSTQEWTAKNSQDALDLGRKKVADIIRDNRDNANWYRLKRNGRSQVGLAANEGGPAYRYEIVPVRIQLLA